MVTIVIVDLGRHEDLRMIVIVDRGRHEEMQLASAVNYNYLKINILAPSAVNYTRKSISWCLATRQML